MKLSAVIASAAEILPLRERYRAEMRCQIIHDSIHRRKGWALLYHLRADEAVAGFGGVAIGGPWKDKPTIFEFYVLPEFRSRIFAFFESLMTSSGAHFIETQTNGTLLAHMLHIWSPEATSEKILFHDKFTTSLSSNGASLRSLTPEPEIRTAMEARQGGGEWVLELEGAVVGKGGLLFHYNRPYGDIYMEVEEKFRRRGFGSYLVQELKRVCYSLGALPGARCNPHNIASRFTLQKAGFVPCGHILSGSIKGR